MTDFKQTEEYKKFMSTIIEPIMNGEKALSYSSLKAFINSPYDFFRYSMTHEQTKAMFEGTVFHCFVLEPERFKSLYFVIEDDAICEEIGGAKPRSTKKYSEWKESILQENIGKEEVSKDLYGKCVFMRERIYSDESANAILSDCSDFEKKYEFVYDQFKFVSKIDADAPYMTVDLKKMASANPAKIHWAIRDNKYDLQGAIYRLATGKQPYLVCADESGGVSVVKFTEKALDDSMNVLSTTLAEFSRCAEEDLWLQSYSFKNKIYEY